ncbi:MAG: hypothetical protein OXN23_03645 [Gammaproteobacteria bacterium]|nr:hypothetical protein [Gammaproteobacteria bacterium]
MQQIVLDFVSSITGAGFTLGFALGFLTMWSLKLIKRLLLCKEVDRAYHMFRMVCEPEIVNPDNPGNQDYMRSQARDMANALLDRLRSAGFHPPDQCTRNEKSLSEWFEFLGKARMELVTWFYKSKVDH